MVVVGKVVSLPFAREAGIRFSDFELMLFPGVRAMCQRLMPINVL